jgi:hypothetical protein
MIAKKVTIVNRAWAHIITGPMGDKWLQSPQILNNVYKLTMRTAAIDTSMVTAKAGNGTEIIAKRLFSLSYGDTPITPG